MANATLGEDVTSAEVVESVGDGGALTFEGSEALGSLRKETYVWRKPFGLNLGRQIGSHDDASGVEDSEDEDRVFKRRCKSRRHI